MRENNGQAGDDQNCADLEVVAWALPSMNGVRDCDTLRGMEGGTIIKIGTFADEGVEVGGVVIDFIPKHSTDAVRVVLAHNDVAAWLAWVGPPKTAAAQE
jgi:hypothetical protein